jgi:hypothetical protein
MKSETTRRDDGTVDIVQRGPAAVVASPAELEQLYWRALHETTFGIVRFARDAVRIAGVWPVLLRFAPPAQGARPILGGLFARAPLGTIRWSSSSGEVTVAVEGFAPRLRGALWRFESWFHEVVGRRFLALAAARRSP